MENGTRLEQVGLSNFQLILSFPASSPLILKISYNLTTLLEFLSNFDCLWIAWRSVDYLLPVKD